MEMKTNTFSILVGGPACNANCPFCVSKMAKKESLVPINHERFRTACQIVEQARDGLLTVILTGKGEPLLYPKAVSYYLYAMRPWRWPIIELQTNGLRLLKEFEEIRNEYLDHWIHAGLTTVSISTTHWYPSKSSRIMGLPKAYDFWEAAKTAHEHGLAVKLNVTMVVGGIDSIGEAFVMIDECKRRGIEQLTLREVVMPTNPKSDTVSDWINVHQLPGLATTLHAVFSTQGTKVLSLPNGGVVYDVNGQNVCVATCLTNSVDENVRQIIFHPDGRITYDWQYPGARIL